MTEKKSLAAVVVVYNTKCEDSLTCCALEKIGNVDLKVVVFDNSTSDFGNRKCCENRGWSYLGGNGNLGISKAYNACIDMLAAENFDGLICLFDDDTDISEEYFEILLKATKTSNADVFVPVIVSANRILSPTRISKNQKITVFSSKQEALNYNGDDITAINSGMAIKKEIFNGYRYDENIFLDGIDHKFVKDMLAKRKKIKVIEYECEHDFSGDSKPSKQSAITRFKIYAKDYKYILREHRILYYWLVGKRAVHLTVIYKTMFFLKVLFDL